RFELLVRDPRPGGPWPDRFVYLFDGSGLPRSPAAYVSWDREPTTGIASDRYALDYEDRWLLTGLRLLSPCGAGADLLDRFKGRAGLSPQDAESEALWNDASIYLGGIVGPVRAIRYVQGAASGLNTIHHDVVYRGRWDRAISLRVHPLDNVWFYF